jgi:hypothetical protein
MDTIGNFLMEVMLDLWGNHLSWSRIWLLVFLELSVNFDCVSKVNRMKRGNDV